MPLVCLDRCARIPLGSRSASRRSTAASSQQRRLWLCSPLPRTRSKGWYLMTDRFRTPSEPLERPLALFLFWFLFVDYMHQVDYSQVQKQENDKSWQFPDRRTTRHWPHRDELIINKRGAAGAKQHVRSSSAAALLSTRSPVLCVGSRLVWRSVDTRRARGEGGGCIFVKMMKWPQLSEIRRALCSRQSGR